MQTPLINLVLSEFSEHHVVTRAEVKEFIKKNELNEVIPGILINEIEMILLQQCKKMIDDAYMENDKIFLCDFGIDFSKERLALQFVYMKLGENVYGQPAKGCMWYKTEYKTFEEVMEDSSSWHEWYYIQGLKMVDKFWLK